MIDFATLEELNRKMFELIHGPAGSSSLLDTIAIVWAVAGPWILALMFAGLWFRTDQAGKTTLVKATVAALLAVCINLLIGIYVYHPRPFMVGLCEPLFTHGPENSFPSDHVSLMFAASISLLLLDKKILWGSSLMTFSFLTAWGRIYCGIHFPMDMIGSFGVGFLVNFLLWSMPPQLDWGVQKLVVLLDTVLHTVFPLKLFTTRKTH